MNVGDRVFDVLIFDWDGTAVLDRRAPIPDLLAAMARVLEDALTTCVIVTGTNVNHLLNQGISKLSPRAKQSLYLCTNRGSEVWGFDANGANSLLTRRTAAPVENQALDRAAIELQRQIQAEGLKTEVIFDRLNRRKIDLIPVPEWANPKKSDFRELKEAVTQRLNKAGLAGGLERLIEDAYRLSRAVGLKSPRITSDIKHIEIGLTDKSDSARWVFENEIQSRRIPVQRVAVLGDELGSIGGIKGSDSFLRIPELEGAAFISVGVEPEGVPRFVNHWGGGPARFVRFLNEQVETRRKSISFAEELSWQVIQEGFEPSRERQMETLFALGNGYLGIRGSSGFPMPTAQPDLFIAGIYGKKVTSVPYSEVDMFTDGSRKSWDSEIVPFPSPLQFRMRGVKGTLFSSDPAEHIQLKKASRRLDLKRALYSEEHFFEDPDGRRTRVRSLRYASLSDSHLIVQQIQVEAENYSGSIELDFSSQFSEQAALYPHLDLIRHDDTAKNCELLQYRTRGGGMNCAVVSRLLAQGEKAGPAHLHVDLSLGRPLEIFRTISIFTDRDESSPLEAAHQHALSCSLEGASERLSAHESAWERFWLGADIRFQGSPEFTQAQRMNLYHLRIAAGNDPRISVPAKALTGRAYEGHIFWDSEIFMFPFFLYSFPDLAKNFLLYRYNTIAGAKLRARQIGFKGACYAWESTVSGEDVTPTSLVIAGEKEEVPIFTGTQEIHITADVAYAVWQYWDATLDLQFLAQHGAEILIETARFWVSRVTRAGNVYHIHEVVGPDEYHHGVSDNAYTNWMAKFNLEKAVWVTRYLKEKEGNSYRALASKVGITDEEIESWKSAAAHLFIPKPDRDGVIEQFQGFRALKPAALKKNERYHAPVSRLLKWSEVNQLRLVKQADLLMIPFLFPNAFSADVLAANYDYYDAITDHGSSLSPCVHAAIAARIGRFEDAKKYWEKSLNLDLGNKMSNTALGIHAAAMGGTWQALAFHILGISLTHDGPRVMRPNVDPVLAFLGDIQFKLVYRGKTFPFHLEQHRRAAA